MEKDCLDCTEKGKCQDCEVTKTKKKRGKCGAECEVYSRVSGYMRPIRNWNPGKRAEFKERKVYKA